MLVAEKSLNLLRHCAQLNSLWVGGLVKQLNILQALPRPLVAPHPLFDHLGPGLVHQAAGLQVLRGKEEEAGDEGVLTPSSSSVLQNFSQYHPEGEGSGSHLALDVTPSV